MLILLYFSSDSLRLYIFFKQFVYCVFSSYIILNGLGLPCFVSLYFQRRYALIIFILPILTPSVKKLLMVSNSFSILILNIWLRAIVYYDIITFAFFILGLLQCHFNRMFNCVFVHLSYVSFISHSCICCVKSLRSLFYALIQ